MSEIKHFLRKHEFPISAKEALLQLEQVCCHGNSPLQQRLAQDIMEEFIFCEVDRRGIRKKRLTAIQELQLLEVMCMYFESQHNEVVRNTVFLTLFHCEGGSGAKMKILGKLVSLSIAVRNMAILSCSSVWMQQQGCTSDIVVSLVRDLVTDYFCLIPRSVSFLQDLPQVSAHFTAHFITAATALYNGAGKKTPADAPDSLLQLITKWVTSNPQLCLAPLTTNLQCALPRGSIVMPSVTPLPGLIRWCIQAPLVEKANDTVDTIDCTDRHQIYAQLHMGILESMMESRKIKAQMVQREIMTTRDFIQLTDSIQHLLVKLGNQLKADQLQIALDRLGQALQVSIAMNCLHGNLGELCWHISRLPEHRLLKVVVEKNRP